MGKNLIQQARGRGGPTYRSPSFRFAGEISHHPFTNPTETITGTIAELLKCPGHSAPLMRVLYADGICTLQSAPEGVRVGEQVAIGPGADIKPGNTLTLSYIPEGTLIYNIENQPGDGGRFCRAGGTFARVISRTDKNVTILLPSKKQKILLANCRATVGIIAGAGREEKPLLRAGSAYWKHRAKNKLYPRIAGNAQNAVDHPFGKGRSHKKGRPTIAPANAPPGANVGKLRPRRTGFKR
ncbi:50S ribosomal protein L2 [Candidatus Woesearchaeota archaeon]|nr:50S ribosomal protein L2 [Candidatus Woesearchaeota archaeon]